MLLLSEMELRLGDAFSYLASRLYVHLYIHTYAQTGMSENSSLARDNIDTQAIKNAREPQNKRKEQIHHPKSKSIKSPPNPK